MVCITIMIFTHGNNKANTKGHKLCVCVLFYFYLKTPNPMQWHHTIPVTNFTHGNNNIPRCIGKSKITVPGHHQRTISPAVLVVQKQKKIRLKGFAFSINRRMCCEQSFGSASKSNCRASFRMTFDFSSSNP